MYIYKTDYYCETAAVKLLLILDTLIVSSVCFISVFVELFLFFSLSLAICVFVYTFMIYKHFHLSAF